eukprot:TRINITY_DN7715_c0_g1_i11.p3 TRINITY_DN7715_c0_g1~~TRINITY_DN7715_c0_g1_i11.p3  ORF type:complete len:106 (-),score=7.94 TRINITY_DN7715_c0_g1_i11:157-474(-)
MNAENLILLLFAMDTVVLASQVDGNCTEESGEQSLLSIRAVQPRHVGCTSISTESKNVHASSPFTRTSAKTACARWAALSGATPCAIPPARVTLGAALVASLSSK